jgi:two-component system alkaline phosphatase synthesis response regulator PhoP
MLPGRSGLEICRDLRVRGISSPVLMLTARGELTDRVLGLKIGADDYLVKPFEMPELVARVEALLRRAAAGMPAFKRAAAGPDARAVHANGSLDRFVFGPFTLDTKGAALFKGKTPIPLTAQEYRLLVHMIAHKGEVLSRNDLLDAVWGYDSMPSTRTVDVHVAWLRRKIEDNPRHPRRIVTVRRLGYKFAA